MANVINTPKIIIRDARDSQTLAIRLTDGDNVFAYKYWQPAFKTIGFFDIQIFHKNNITILSPICDKELSGKCTKQACNAIDGCFAPGSNNLNYLDKVLENYNGTTHN